MEKYKNLFEQMVKATENYLIENNIKTMVLGISGGLDSTVTAAICYEVVKRNQDQNFNFIGVSLPCSSNTEEENNSASICMKAFCNEYWTENLQKEYMMMKATCELHTESTHISQGNIKARLRMLYLYNIASTRRGIVMDTDNLTEHYLGFFTIHGDVADFNPIGRLWKHEVYEMAKYLRDKYQNDINTFLYGPDSFDHIDDLNSIEQIKNRVAALDYALGIRPTDGNGVNDLGDMGQIAPEFAHDKNIDAYTKVDDIIQTYLYAVTQYPEQYQIAMDELYKKYPIVKNNDVVIYDTVRDVINRIKSTEFKRKHLPIVPKLS